MSNASDQQISQPNGHNHYTFISYLRLIACSIIVYTHLVAMRFPELRPVIIIRAAINTPLHIIQDFGAFGVCLFYIISGFLVALSAGKQTWLKFLLNKIIRVYFGAILAATLFYVVQKIIEIMLGTPTFWGQRTAKDWIMGGTLIGYLSGYGDQINGTTWFLIPYLFFIIIFTLSYKILKTNPIPAILILELSVLLFTTAYIYIPAIKIAVGFFAFVPMCISGVLIYCWQSKLIKNTPFGLFMVANYLIMIFAFYRMRAHYYTDQPYLVSYIISLGLFMTASLANDRLLPGLRVKTCLWFCDKYSFAIYLSHMQIGGLVMSLITAYMPTTLVVVLGMLCVLGYSMFFHQFIEIPLTKGSKLLMKFVR